MFYKKALLGLFAATAAAIPVEELSHEGEASGNNGKMTLLPKVHPDVDRANLNHLAASRDSKLHYDSDPNPHVDSTIATLTAPGAQYPIVQLENSQFINGTQCTDDQAHISFNNRTAYEAAVADWQKHPQFIIIAYDPKCGTGVANGKREFALVEKVTPDDGAMTVDADIKFVNYVAAIGNKTMIHAAVGKYTAPTAKRWSVSKTLSLNWNEFPTNSLSTNQWGSGYQLLQSSKLDVICVGCGTKGNLDFTGSVDFSFFGGFDSASISLKGDMSGQLAIGLNARGVSGSIPIASHQLAQIPIGGVEIPDIISLGPQIDISVGASLSLKATGSLLLGAELSWSSIDVELGLSGDDTKKGDGLTPTVTPKDSVSGTLTATLDLHLPVSIGIGINILDGTWNKSLAVVDTPGFQLSASRSNDPGSCSGIELSADVYNNVGVDILEVTTFGLASWTTSFWSTCLFGSTGSPTPTGSPTGPGQTTVKPTYTTTRTVKKSTYPGSSPTPASSPYKSSPKPPATTPKPTYTTKAPPPPKSYTTKAPPPPPKTYTTPAPPPPKTYTTKAPPPPKSTSTSSYSTKTKPTSSPTPKPKKRLALKARREEW